MGVGHVFIFCGATAVKLVYSSTSPFVRRVLACAIELGISERIELEPLQVAPGRKNDTYAATVNPLRKIPALVLEDGTVLMDSGVICDYLNELAGGEQLIASSGALRWGILTQQAVAAGMTEALVLARYETALRPEAFRWAEWVDDQQGRFWSGLDWFERRAPQVLQDSRVDISQLALACCLGYADFRFPELDWAARVPLVKLWYGRMAARPSLAQTQPR
jgi:glutathione S-transferase